MPLLTLVGCHLHVVRLFQPNGTKIMAQLPHTPYTSESLLGIVRTRIRRRVSLVDADWTFRLF